MKTFNKFKTTALVAFFILAANFAYSTDGAMAKAKSDLHDAIIQVFKEDISEYGNYLYENQIYKINDKAKVTFRVKENRELELINVKCRNCDAVGYIKNVIAQSKVKASQLLVGEAYTVDIHLKFKAN